MVLAGSAHTKSSIYQKYLPSFLSLAVLSRYENTGAIGKRENTLLPEDLPFYLS